MLREVTVKIGLIQYLIQSNMEDQVYQIQRMLADKLDIYSGQENQYMNDNI